MSRVDRKLFLYFALQKCRSSACHILPYEDITHDAYMQEVNAAMLYGVILAIPSPLYFSLTLYSSACQAYCKELMHDERPRYEDVIFVSIDGQILQPVLICINLHGSISMT